MNDSIRGVRASSGRLSTAASARIHSPASWPGPAWPASSNPAAQEGALLVLVERLQLVDTPLVHRADAFEQLAGHLVGAAEMARPGGEQDLRLAAHRVGERPQLGRRVGVPHPDRELVVAVDEQGQSPGLQAVAEPVAAERGPAVEHRGGHHLVQALPLVAVAQVDHDRGEVGALVLEQPVGQAADQERLPEPGLPQDQQELAVLGQHGLVDVGEQVSAHVALDSAEPVDITKPLRLVQLLGVEPVGVEPAAQPGPVGAGLEQVVVFGPGLDVHAPFPGPWPAARDRPARDVPTPIPRNRRHGNAAARTRDHPARR
jgi:hypothetical protein